MTKARLALVAAAALLQACAGTSMDAVQTEPSAAADLAPTPGHSASGTVEFTRKGDLVEAEAKLTGLPPNSRHGFHIHENGDCSAPDASSAGAHFDPTASPHGGPTGVVRHGGDLGNVEADAQGNVEATIRFSGVSIDDGPDRILGRSLILHASPDDLTSQPSGNSGARIACGVINPAPGQAS